MKNWRDAFRHLQNMSKFRFSEILPSEKRQRHVFMKSTIVVDRDIQKRLFKLPKGDHAKRTYQHHHTNFTEPSGL